MMTSRSPGWMRSLYCGAVWAPSAFRTAARGACERAFPQREHCPLESVRVVARKSRRRGLLTRRIRAFRGIARHLRQAENQCVVVPQKYRAITRFEHREMAFQTRAREFQPLCHALLERIRGRDRYVLVHDADAAACQRQEQRRRDDMSSCQFEDVFDGHRRALVEQCDERPEKAVDVAFVQGEEELFLAWEIKIDRALGKSGRPGHLGHARDAAGGAQQEPLRPVQDRVVTLVLLATMDGALQDYHAIAN